MEAQPVRKNIALKLRDPGGSSPFTKVDVPTNNKKSEVGAGGSSGAGYDYSNLKWDHVVNLCGRPITDPLLHLCENCSLPVLIYGRMKRCRHAFCRDCAKKSSGVCPKCQEGEQTFEEASMGTVHICTHGGGRYDNTGCGRSYLSQRDLEAHRLYRHTKDKGLGQSVVPTHLTVPPPQAAISGFSLPPFFQPGIMAPQFPPGFAAGLPPPSALGAVLRPLPPNPMMVGGRPSGVMGGPGLLPPPPAPPFAAAPRPLSNAGVSSAVSGPPSGSIMWTHPSSFKQ